MTGNEKKGSFVYGLYTAPNPERNEIAVTPKIPIRCMKNDSGILSSHVVVSVEGDLLLEGRFAPNLQNPNRNINIAETFVANAIDLVRFELSINVLIVYCGNTNVTRTHMIRRFTFQHIVDSSKFMISHSNKTNRFAPIENVKQNNAFTDALDVKLENMNLEKKRLDKMNRHVRERSWMNMIFILFFVFVYVCKCCCNFFFENLRDGEKTKPIS